METHIHVGNEVSHDEETIAAPARPTSHYKLKVLLIGAIFAVVAAVVYSRMHSGVQGPMATPVPTVAVAKVVRQNISNEVPIPAEFRPYVQSELHAMVTGYVSQINVDFGDKVKKGEVLATLEVPELADELHNAQARQQQAEADYRNEHLMYTRLQTVNQQHPTLVAKQDIDTAMAKDASGAATIAAAKAEVEKYQTLLNYMKIVAPFDGVITQRSVDPGALVQAGTSSDRSMPLLRVSDNYHLRLDFPVSVDYVKDVHTGDRVTVRVDSLGGKTFTGNITRAKEEVNAATRTMITELEVENPNLEIVPGMYAVVLFRYARHKNTLAVPVQAIRDPKNPVVYALDKDNVVEAVHVKIGLETSDQFEVTDGLEEGELVLVGNQSQVHPGEKVEPKMTNPGLNLTNSASDTGASQLKPKEDDAPGQKH